MESYTIIKEIGKGAYGTVYKAIHNQSKQQVAIKQIHQATDEKVSSKNLIELRSFIKIKNHPNLVRLYEVFKDEKGRLCFVFEFINSGSLYDYVVQCQKMNTRISENELRSIIFFFLQGMNHIHGSNFIHRDLKLENILMQAPETEEEELYASRLGGSSKPLVLKVADLGCAKETRQRFVQNTVYTGTRWYRSVEMLMRDQTYGKPNDVWGIGCIAAELILGRPLFPGKSELDQLHMIFQQLGPLLEQEWPEYAALAAKLGFVSTVPVSPTRYITGASHRRVSERLSALLGAVSSECVDCIAWMLELNPQRRWTTQELLNHPWLRAEQQKFGGGQHLAQMRSASPDRGKDSGNPLLDQARHALNDETRSESVPVYGKAFENVIGDPTRSISNANAKPNTHKAIKNYLQQDALEDNVDLGGLEDL